MVAEIIEQKKEEIAALCRTYRVRRLDLFGSATSDRFDSETSDVDFVVVFAGDEQGILYRYVDLAVALERLLGRPVDLLTERSIGSPEFRSSVDASRVTIYGIGPRSSDCVTHSPRRRRRAISWAAAPRRNTSLMKGSSSSLSDCWKSLERR